MRTRKWQPPRYPPMSFVAASRCAFLVRCHRSNWRKHRWFLIPALLQLARRSLVAGSCQASARSLSTDCGSGTAHRVQPAPSAGRPSRTRRLLGTTQSLRTAPEASQRVQRPANAQPAIGRTSGRSSPGLRRPTTTCLSRPASQLSTSIPDARSSPSSCKTFTAGRPAGPMRRSRISSASAGLEISAATATSSAEQATPLVHAAAGRRNWDDVPRSGTMFPIQDTIPHRNTPIMTWMFIFMNSLHVPD